MRHLTFITLGVADLKKSRAFYGDVFGWTPAGPSDNNIAFFDMGGFVLALFPRDHLAKDAQVEAAGSGFSGVTLAHNVPRREDVKPFIDKAVAAGATLKKPAQDVFWGGHSGYFADPDGHLWEVAWNPFMPLDADGRLLPLPAATTKP